MHIVLVELHVKPEMVGEFEGAVLLNARESVAKEPGCLRFDVSQVLDDPTIWILHEVYDTRESHVAHRESAHFLAFSEVMGRTVTMRRALSAAGKHITP